MSGPAFDPGDVDGNALALALVQLRPGEHGPAQPRAVRMRLVDLEAAGLAAWNGRARLATDRARPCAGGVAGSASSIECPEKSHVQPASTMNLAPVAFSSHRYAAHAANDNGPEQRGYVLLMWTGPVQLTLDDGRPVLFPTVRVRARVPVALPGVGPAGRDRLRVHRAPQRARRPARLRSRRHGGKRPAGCRKDAPMIDASNETNEAELLSDDRAVADTEPPPPPAMPTERPHRHRILVELVVEGDGADALQVVNGVLDEGVLQAAIYEHEQDAGPLGVVSATVSHYERLPSPPLPASAPAKGPTLREVWAVLARAANAAGRLSRRPGAPVLSAESPRETLIAWLQWNDGNGDFDNPVVWREGPEGLLDEGWWVSAPEGHRQWFGTGPEAESKARAYAASLTVSIDELWESLASMDLEDVAGVKS